MIEWLGIEHLFELSTGEKIAGLFTPLVLFAAFAIVQIILPARWVPGYVIDEATGEPRRYRLNGILVFGVAVLVWAFLLPELGMERDWFYRTSLYAVAGGTAAAVLATVWGVYSQPQVEKRNPFVDFYLGRALELSFFNNRLDLKMTFYVLGGTMLVINAMSGAAWHYEEFKDAGQVSPGVFLYAAFYVFYVFDYFIFERVQLYTFDVIHERLGFKLFWGGNIIYGWLFIVPLYGMAAQPDPGFGTAWTYVWIIGSGALFLIGWSISRGANMQKYTFKRWPDRKFLGLIEPRYIEAGDRKILTSGLWGAARHFNYMGEGFFALAIALSFGHFDNPWAWTYSVFIVSFFTWRQREDDKACAEKYGAEKWAEYQQQVKYRIFPGIY